MVLEEKRKHNKKSLRKMIIWHAVSFMFLLALTFFAYGLFFGTFMVFFVTAVAIFSLIVYLKMLYHLYNYIY